MLVPVVGGVMFILGCLFGAGLFAVALHFRAGAAAVPFTHVLEDAYTSCSSPYGITVGDNGRSLEIDTEGAEDGGGASSWDAECVLEALDVPDYVLTQIRATRALDGTLHATWNGLEATWNYHPDSGMTMAIHAGGTLGGNS